MPKVRVFSRGDIGSLVFDTRRHCCGLYGFLGMYATVGLPRRGHAVNVAFEIPILYNGWNDIIVTRACMTAAHLGTFRRLQAALRFVPNPPVNDSVEWTAAHTSIISGGTGT